LHNPSSNLAFAVRLKVNKGSSHRVSREAQADEEILPVLWNDNYFELLPGQTREVSATFRAPEKTFRPSLQVEGWNVRSKAIGIQ